MQKGYLCLEAHSFACTLCVYMMGNKKHCFLLLWCILYISLCPWLVASLRHDNSTDLSALLSFKSHITSDPRSILANTWNLSTSFCAWTGILCSHRRQRVTALTLPGLSLEGDIAPHIGNLSFLSMLDLSNSKLGGQVPESLGSLRRLRYLNLSFNQLSGQIPLSLFNISSLRFVHMEQNKLSGPIPANLCQSRPQLQDLSLDANQITGSIPPNIKQCQHLQWLSLLQNKIIGEIPIEIGELTELIVLDLLGNNFTGSIPPSLGNLTMLKFVDLASNNLQGSIPQELGGLHNLQVFNLASNKLSGNIPPEIFNLSSLVFLQVANNLLSSRLPGDSSIKLPNLQDLLLQYNFFNGEIPPALFNSSSIDLIHLCDNHFTGPIPTGLGSLSLLTDLNIAHNRLTGNIPTHLLSGNLTSLLSLKLNDNQLTGTIPPEIIRLQNLQGLDLSQNKLQGTIPHELLQIKNLETLLLHENMLTGSIPNHIGNMSRLRVLSLASNALSSTIPFSVWSLKDLLHLNLSWNYLTGVLPREVGNLKVLVNLSVSSNQLSGDIPGSLGGLEMLAILDLSNNSFSGAIPQSFGGLMSMEDMDLSFNALSGAIPKSLELLRYVKHLNFSFNRLEGQIPAGGIFGNLTSQSFLGNPSLCGATKLGVHPCKADQTSRRRMLVFKYILPVIASIVICAVVLFFVMKCEKGFFGVPVFADASAEMTQSMLSHQEILCATDNFNEENLLGMGSSGSVYKAQFDDGTLAAIKVLNLQSERASKTFDAELKVMRMIRHRNLVKIINSCSRPDFKALVLQFMPNGSLEKWLYSNSHHLSLLQRLNIMLDVASALEYLHHDCVKAVVHCDLKPSNVLLDEDMTAHVGDFGIAKLLHGDNKSITLTNTPGTIGYVAPEYGLMGKLSARGDVYSYGILLLETLTGKKPTDAMFTGGLSLRKWVDESCPEGVRGVVDEFLVMGGGENGDCHNGNGKDAENKCLLSLLELGLLCSKESPKERMTMRQVVVRLTKIRVDFSLNFPNGSV